mmetsp:Transcript_18810/g.31259  ORF Transcript_18810/g.31259 Transcript_18810/m.31259 type:complete len:301 (-) Transcript_18810:132-1034(-)
MCSITDPLCNCKVTNDACSRNDFDGSEDTVYTVEPILSASARRYAVAATAYEADQTDPIDVQLAFHLSSIDHQSLCHLFLKRLRPGEYEIDGRPVSIHWGAIGPGPCASTELLVCERDENDEWDTLETSVPLYLRQACEVAASLRGLTSGSPIVARVPQDKRLSFLDWVPAVGAPQPENNPEAERLICMHRACAEAQMREDHAHEFERQMVERQSYTPCTEVLLPRAVSVATSGSDPPLLRPMRTMSQVMMVQRYPRAESSSVAAPSPFGPPPAVRMAGRAAQVPQLTSHVAGDAQIRMV